MGWVQVTGRLLPHSCGTCMSGQCKTSLWASPAESSISTKVVIKGSSISISRKDHNFKPKISDFGLAKLRSKDQSIVSMTTVRGTIGYIAPEVFSKTFGNVSYKYDVCSFGMLLLEMVRGRKNINVTEENIDEIYYQEWIYNTLEGGEDHRMQIEGRGDATIAKGFAIVGLWCIQWHPMGLPTMKDVVQMLDGAAELTVPPTPLSATDPEAKTKPPTRRMTLELETIAE